MNVKIQGEPAKANVKIQVGGKDGQTPHIGEDGNWYIGEKNTGKPSRGEKGNPGYSPEINVTDVPGGHAISIKDADGITHVVNVKDGLDGKDGKNATIEHRWDGTKLFITSSSGISYADLQGPKGDKGDPAKPWLIGSTDEITPNDVMTALASERNVLLTHSTEEFGRIAFSYFTISTDGDFVATSCALAIEGVAAVFQLIGMISSDTWEFMLSPLTDVGLMDRVDQVEADIDKLSEEIGDKGDVKTVNGLAPDASGNVNLQVKENFDLTGQCITVDGMKEGGKIGLIGTLTNPYVDAISYKVIHCGRNLLDCGDMPNNHTVPITYDGDGWITFEADGTQTATKWVNAFYYFPWLPPLSKYKFCFELSSETSVTGTATLYAVSNNADEFFSTNLQAMTDFTKPGVYAAIVETKAADKMRVNMALSRMAIGFSAGASGKIQMRPWVVKCDDSLTVSTKFGLVYNETYPGYYGETLAVSISGSYSGTYDWGEVTAFEGDNTFSTAWGELNAKGEKVLEYASGAAAKLDVTQYKLPILFLNGSIGGMSKDNAVTLSYKYEGREGSCTLKWQGSSSLAHPKKNYTIKFDQEFEAKTGWGNQKKYVLKANFMDHTHSRNICSCKLWGHIVKSRANVPAVLSSLPNGGAIDGFPIIIMLNGEFHGLYTFNIPKDGWMYGAPKAIVCADNHVDATKFKALATLSGDFELEYAEDEDNTDWILPSLNKAIQAVIDGDLDTAGQYIDVPSAIDYYIHTVYEGGLDGTDHNYLLVTFDGTKWYFGTYDRDRVYGIGWSDDDFISPVGGLTFAEFANIHKLMELIMAKERSTLKARAVELRGGAMAEANVYAVFTNFMQAIPTQILDEDVRLYPTIPSTNVHNLAQILNWYRLRCIAVDAEINAM